jgi:hypothetical protein
VLQAGQTARWRVSPSSGNRRTTAVPQFLQCLIALDQAFVMKMLSVEEGRP